MGNTINIYYHRRANKYLNKLGKNEKTKLMVLINSKIQDFIKKKDRRYIYQEKYFSKLGKFDSTIYYLKISNDSMAIISIDEDPIFEETTVTIYTICKHDKLRSEIQSIMESLYQKMINDDVYDEGDE